MRIDDHIDSRRHRLQTNRIKTERNVEPSRFFKVLKQERYPSAREEMDELLRKLDEQARRLIHSRTLIDLNHYKKLVYQFVERAVGQGIALAERHSTDARGRSRIYRCVEKIDEQLVQLTDDVLEREKSRLHLLERIGQIKGLLIQLNA